MTTKRMSEPDFDRLLTTWFETDARVLEPEALADTALARVQQSRRLPAWILPERWIPMRFSLRLHVAVRLLAIALLIVLLAVAGVWALTVGSPRPLPQPFGAAANGLLAYDTKSTIFVTSEGAREGRPLVEGVFHAASPTWSPDGAHLAFWGDESPDSLFVADADGSNVRRLTSQIWISTDKPPTWSPDGRFIAFSAESGPDRVDERLSVVEIATGVVTRLGPAGPIDVRSFFPSWSPDGNWIAFVGVPPIGSDLGLWVVRPDGRDRHRLPTSRPVELIQPQWAPSGDSPRLVYATRHTTKSWADIYVLDVATGVETPISSDPDDDSGPTWSPDATALAWLIDGLQPRLRIATIGPPTTVTTLASDGITTPLAWSPDGTKIYGLNTTRTLLVVVTVDGSSPTVRITHDQSQGAPAWQRRAP